MAPRRLLLLVLLSAVTTSVILFTVVSPPELPLPTYASLRGEDWLEFGGDGRCVFLSPLDELSAVEREAALALASDPHPPTTSGLLDYDPSAAAGSSSSGGGASQQNASRRATTHPILGLLVEGERRWADLVDRQSRSLEEAVVEYKKRYGRNPPKGFDDWWSFAQGAQVWLPDEYDPIMASLRPFFALPYEELQKRLAEAEKLPETFTLIVKASQAGKAGKSAKGGKVVLQWNDAYSRDTWWNTRPRADAQINLMEPFLDRITEDMRITFSIHDQPGIVLPFERRQELEGLAERVGAYTKDFDEKDLVEADWAGACPPDSAARQDGGSAKQQTGVITFVEDHLKAMDPCINPELLTSHSFYTTPRTAKSLPRPHTRLLPMLSLSRTPLSADIPLAPVGILSSFPQRTDVGREPLGGWSAKSNKLYWRGSPTSHREVLSAQAWEVNHTPRLHRLGVSNSTVRRPLLVPAPNRDGTAKVVEVEEHEAAQAFFDIHLQGGWSCEDGATDCKAANAIYSKLPKDDVDRTNDYKYVLDVDGDSWSKRFPKLLAAENLVIKAGIFPEWNMATLPPWFAYVPASLDFSDLPSIMAFFRGSPGSSRGAHDRVARRIASNGQCWAETMWRAEDHIVYAYRLYLEFARLVSPDRDTGEMDYVHGARRKPMPEAPPAPKKETGDAE